MSGADEHEVIQLDDDEGRQLHATWSRSGKRLIVTVRKDEQWAQIELRPEQAEQLGRFLTQSR